MPLPQLPTASAPGLHDLIQTALNDLSNRLSISRDQITLTDAKTVIWSNSSLGCPQPGMAYMEALIPGYLILLTADGREYEYHAGNDAKVFLCESPISPVEGEPGNI
jgi:hypothetical protein